MTSPRKTLPLWEEPTLTTFSRGRRADYIAVMDPVDFLRLTTANDEQLEFMLGCRIIDGHLDGTEDWDRFCMPHLWIQPDSGRVLQHDGRHRSIMVHQAGGDRVPVGLLFEGVEPDQPLPGVPLLLCGQYAPAIQVPLSRMRLAASRDLSKPDHVV